jgi:hypothetical protein
MPSPRRSPSPSRSATSGLLLLAFAALAASGCGDGDDDVCGPGDQPAPGLTVEAAAVTFGDFAASANNDCPPTAGEHPTSVTIQGEQVDPAVASQFLVLCLPRPDLIDDQPVPLTDGERIQLIDLFGRDADGCDIRFDSAAEPGNAAVTFSGFCDSGTDPAGFAIELSGVLPITRSCEGADSALTSELGGRAAVASAPL